MFAMLLAFDSKDYAEHPDIKVIDSENLNTLGVEDIRDVINKDSLSPIEGRYKVVIFPPIKSLDIEEGQVGDGVYTWKVNITSPMAITIESTATVDGDTITGESKLGAFGTATFTGSRA